MLIEPFILAAAAATTLTVAYCASLFAARSRNILDHPNDRSSHTAATPRAGGLAIIGGWCAGLFVVSAFSANAGLAADIALLAAAALCALLVGLVDDRVTLPPAWKFAGQIAVAALFIASFGSLQSAPLPHFGNVALGPVWGAVVTGLWIVGFMNAFNFMDGANGLAGGAAATGLAWIAVGATFTGAPFVAAAALLLALAASGFLPQNLRRGRLFMGDNGSLSLGFLIAAFAVIGANASEERMSALFVPVVFLPLLFDVALTLVSRVIRKRNILHAHREHLYQLMMRSGASHASVAVVYMGAVSLSAAAAFLMLALPAPLQWIAPLMLALLFSLGAAMVYRRAFRLGLLKDVPPAPETPASEADDASLQAAE
jgi:UDP-GlcNAc:undecaprenyl-phosphate GlcNAc-1-phosphate transferase